MATRLYDHFESLLNFRQNLETCLATWAPVSRARMVGGEIKSMTKLTKDLRNELILEAMEQAKSMGANAITGIRLETSSVFEGILDCVLYGTAIHYT